LRIARDGARCGRRLENTMNTIMHKLAAVAMAVAGLTLGGPTGWAAIYTGGEGAYYAMYAMTNDVNVATVLVSISSDADQGFVRGYAAAAISPITITDATNTPVISNGVPIAVSIPEDLVMTWDETCLTPTLSGSAAGKVGLISYTNLNKRLLIEVTTNFDAGDTLVVSNLAFENYLDVGSSHLELDYDNDGVPDAQDDKTITITGWYSYGGFGANCAVGQMLRDKYLNPLGTLWLSY